MAVDELTARLQDAAKHFVPGGYATCLRVLQTCPAEDPKVASNTALTQFLLKGGNVRDTTEVSSLIPRPSGGPGGIPHVAFEYEGHDVACVNAAIMRWHLGDMEGARELLSLLATNAHSLSPKALVRTAVALQLTRGIAPSVAEHDKLVATLLADKTAYQADAQLSKLVQTALASGSGATTRTWFSSIPKADVLDKIVYCNNVGIDAFSQGKHGVAGVLFAKAMTLTTTGAASSPLCPFVVSSVAFNVALCALSRGDGNAAAVALSVAQQTMSGSPQYWIRVAQATALRAGKKMRQASHRCANTSEQSQSAALAAHGRATTTANAIAAFSQRRPLLSAEPEVRVLLNHVRHAAHNVLMLVTKGDPLSATAHRCANSYLNFGALTSALVYAAWAELQLGNHAVAAKYALDFFNIFKVGSTPVNRAAVAAALTYAVEALCATNRAAQALRLMASLELGEVIAENMSNGYSEALFITLCVAHIMNGSWSKAVAVANHVVAKFQSRYAQLLLVYVELAQGNRDKALDLLEKAPILAPDAV